MKKTLILVLCILAAVFAYSVFAEPCGTVMPTGEVNLTSDVSCSGLTNTGFGIKLENNTVLDCQGYKIYNDNKLGNGISIKGKSNITIRNCEIYGFYAGVTARGSAFDIDVYSHDNMIGAELNSVFDSSFKGDYDSNNDGLRLYTSDHNILDVLTSGNSNYGVLVGSGSEFNTIKQTSSDDIGVKFDGGDNNILTQSSINAGSYGIIFTSGSNSVEESVINSNNVGVLALTTSTFSMSHTNVSATGYALKADNSVFTIESSEFFSDSNVSYIEDSQFSLKNSRFTGADGFTAKESSAIVFDDSLINNTFCSDSIAFETIGFTAESMQSDFLARNEFCPSNRNDYAVLWRAQFYVSQDGSPVSGATVEVTSGDKSYNLITDNTGFTDIVLVYGYLDGEITTMAYAYKDEAYGKAYNIYTSDATGSSSTEVIIKEPYACGLVVSDNLVLDRDVVCKGNTDTTGVKVNTSNITIDCAGYKIIKAGGSANTGVSAKNKEYVTIKNCTIQNFPNAMALRLNNSIIEATIENATIGILMTPSFNNIVTADISKANVGADIQSSKNNQFSFTTSEIYTVGAKLQSSSNNNVILENFSSPEATGVAVLKGESNVLNVTSYGSEAAISLEDAELTSIKLDSHNDKYGLYSVRSNNTALSYSVFLNTLHSVYLIDSSINMLGNDFRNSSAYAMKSLVNANGNDFLNSETGLTLEQSAYDIKGNLFSSNNIGLKFIDTEHSAFNFSDNTFTTNTKDVIALWSSIVGTFYSGAEEANISVSVWDSLHETNYNMSTNDNGYSQKVLLPEFYITSGVYTNLNPYVFKAEKSGSPALYGSLVDNANRTRTSDIFRIDLSETQLADIDSDGIEDSIDNCFAIYNPNQADSDSDGLGDYCDALPYDHDNDGFNSTIDCDDNNASISPNATEVCNNIDDNCDNQIDENNVCGSSSSGGGGGGGSSGGGVIFIPQTSSNTSSWPQYPEYDCTFGECIDGLQVKECTERGGNIVSYKGELKCRVPEASGNEPELVEVGPEKETSETTQIVQAKSKGATALYVAVAFALLILVTAGIFYVWRIRQKP